MAKTCNVALLGQGFMGRTHSNAYLKVAKFFAEYQRGGRRDGWQLDEGDYDSEHRASVRDFADSVYLNRFVLGGAQNERRLTYLPLQDISQLQASGLYMAVMKPVGRYNGEYETAIFYVSDIGLHLRAYKDKVYVHTASLKSGASVRPSALHSASSS